MLDKELFQNRRFLVRYARWSYWTQVGKADEASAPTFGSELLTRQGEDLSQYTSALQTTVMGILRSEAADKGAQIATALDDFRAAVLGKLREAGLSVPTEKRAGVIPLRTEAALLNIAAALSPEDLLKHYSEEGDRSPRARGGRGTSGECCRDVGRA